MAEGKSKHEYTLGHSKSTTASHESRSINSDAAFLIPYIKPNDHILDVGCGPGTITTGFRSLAPSGRVVGIDYSETVIQRAKELAKEQGHHKDVEFLQGNLLERLPFEDESFDIIFGSQVFVHLQPAQYAIQAIKECRRVLKTGGLLAIRDVADLAWYPFSEELDRLFTKNLWRQAGGSHGGGMQIRQFLREAGFDVEDEHKVKIGGGSTVYANREKCQWWSDLMVSRLRKGEATRNSWLKVGLSEEVCDEAAEMLRKWGESDDAFYAALQSESLAWK